MKFTIPETLTREHEALHGRLNNALQVGGAVAAATQNLIDKLHPHFVREEEIAMPPLGLLVMLSHGEYYREMDQVLAYTDALAEELPRMLKEHEGIKAAVEQLRVAALEAGREDIAAFCDDLGAHARSEEEVLYPAALLVGDLVRWRSAKAA